MANIKSAKKRIRVIDKKTARNRRVKNHLKTILKNFEQAMEEGNLEVAQEKLHLAERNSCRQLLRIPFLSMRLQEKFQD